MAVSEKKKVSNHKWNAQNMAYISASIRNTEKEQLREVCEQNGTTVSAVILRAVREFVASHTDSPAPLPLPTGWAEQKPSVLRTLRTPDGWQLDVDDDGRAYGAWLTHSSCSVKVFLAGADKSKHTIDEFTSLILADIDTYKADYRHDHM